MNEVYRHTHIPLSKHLNMCTLSSKTNGPAFVICLSLLCSALAFFAFGSLYLALPCFALLCFALLCFALLSLALIFPQFVLLCFALPCFALLSFVLLCLALPCFALLWLCRDRKRSFKTKTLFWIFFVVQKILFVQSFWKAEASLRKIVVKGRSLSPYNRLERQRPLSKQWFWKTETSLRIMVLKGTSLSPKWL